MTDRFAAEAMRVARELPEDAREDGLRIGRALRELVAHIPTLEGIHLQGVDAIVMNDHLASLRSLQHFYERMCVAYDAEPAA